MSHAAATQPTTVPDVNAQADTGQQVRPSSHVSDIAIAAVAARAVRTVPGVVDLSAGRVALAATYGAGQRVNGVVIHHSAPEALLLEIHVVLSDVYPILDSTATAQDAAGHGPERLGSLTEIASRIRGVVCDAAHEITPLALLQVDVFIDDLR